MVVAGSKARMNGAGPTVAEPKLILHTDESTQSRFFASGQEMIGSIQATPLEAKVTRTCKNLTTIHSN